MVDLEWYEVVGVLFLCWICGMGGICYIVKNFGCQIIDVVEMYVEIFIYESDCYEVVFENNVIENVDVVFWLLKVFVEWVE